MRAVGSLLHIGQVLYSSSTLNLLRRSPRFPAGFIVSYSAITPCQDHVFMHSMAVAGSVRFFTNNISAA